MRVAPVEAPEIIGVLFVMIHLSVAVFVMENGNLAAVQNEDSLIVNVDPNRLIEARCVSLPSYFIEVVGYSLDQPYVSGQERPPRHLHWEETPLSLAA